MGPDEIVADKLAYAYSVTAHRSQGQTVDAKYALADGGGRELAYVAMSRARGESHVHVVATDLRQASQRLAWAWGQERRQAWALDRRPGKSLAELHAERGKLARSIPPDRSAELAEARQRWALAEQDQRDLRQGTGRWAGTPAGIAAHGAAHAAVEYKRASEALESRAVSRWARYKTRRELKELRPRFNRAMETWRAVGETHERNLEAQSQRFGAEVGRLEAAQRARDTFLERHPDALGRLAELDCEVAGQEDLERRRHWALVSQRGQQHLFQPSHSRGPDRGHGIGL